MRAGRNDAGRREDIMPNMHMTRRALGAAAIALSLAATAALAQQPARIRGQIEKVGVTVT